eukprot:CAMPEP_0180431286 /NCGR_PEP_ID=MMETSP1036_2-20121128/8321_1 /TAXON_ID=632150 /ORGANISM="Azadinium spinosum, Strain 3D9" /LENGTH=89 /DNA_ID=CAMNT_0022437043 /DNA_START=416 /DNA_END=685 /DNA_ORIENTATION=-
MSFEEAIGSASKMFKDFRSLWIMHGVNLCKYSMAVATLLHMATIWDQISSTWSCWCKTSKHDPPAQYSMTMIKGCDWVTMPIRLTMLGW